jgi:hypothetical protein
MTDPDVLAAAVVRLHAEGAGDKAGQLLASLKKQQKAMSAYDTASGGALVPTRVRRKKRSVSRLFKSLEAEEPAQKADQVPLERPTIVNVTMPEQPAPIINLTMPEQMFTFPEQPAPVVNVNVPEQPAPVVNVNVPQQPAPVVNMSAPVVNVAAPQATPGRRQSARKDPVSGQWIVEEL